MHQLAPAYVLADMRWLPCFLPRHADILLVPAGVGLDATRVYLWCHFRRQHLA